jgi:hypothetical protein
MTGLGVLAMLLAALAPTISQLRVGSAASRTGIVAMAHALHADAGGSLHRAGESGGKAPVPCWKTCGYCDFFMQTPAVGVVVFVFLPVVASSAPPLPLRAIGRAGSRSVLAAHPRAPPVPA